MAQRSLATMVTTNTTTAVRTLLAVSLVVGAVAVMGAFGSSTMNAASQLIRPSLTVRLSADTPPAQTIIAPATNVDLAHFDFILTGAVRRIPITRLTFNVQTNLADGRVKNVSLYDAAGNRLAGPGPVDNYHHTVTFNGLFPIVAGNPATKLIIKADVDPDPGQSRQLRLTINPSRHITAITPSSKFAILPRRDITSKIMTVIEQPPQVGAFSVTIDDLSPKSSLLAGNSPSTLVAVFRLAANDIESLDLDSFKITDDGADTAVTNYTFFANTLGEGTPIGSAVPVGGVAEIHLANNTVTIPRNSSVFIAVRADISPVGQPGIPNGTALKVTVNAAGDIEATGLTSGVTIGSTNAPIYTATHWIYKTFPQVSVATDSPSGALPLGVSTTIAKFNICTIGPGDVTFSATDGNRLVVQLNSHRADDAVNNNDIITLYDDNGTLLDRTTGRDFDSEYEFMFDFDQNDLAIPGGQCKTVLVKIDSTDFEDTGDAVQAWLDDTAFDLDFGIDGSDSYEVGNIVFRGDIFANNLYHL